MSRRALKCSRLVPRLVAALAVGTAPLPLGAESELTKTASDARSSDDGNTSDATQDVLEAAREAFKRGVAHAAQDRLEQALSELRRSLELHAHPATHYNIGVCELRIGHLARGRHHLLLALADRIDPLKEAHREVARSKLEQVERRLAAIEVTLPSGPALVRLDGRPLTYEAASDGPRLVAGVVDDVGWTTAPAAQFEILVEPGRHELDARIAGVDRKLQFELNPSERLRWKVPAPAREPETRAPPRKAPSVPLRAREPSVSREGSASAPWATLAFGVAAAGTVTASIFGVLALNSRAKLDEVCEGPSRCPAGSTDEINRLKRCALIADFGLAAALVGGGAGVWLSLSSPSTPAGEANIGVSGRF